MNPELPESRSEPSSGNGRQTSAVRPSPVIDAERDPAQSAHEASRQPATVIVRGETVREPAAKPTPDDSSPGDTRKAAGKKLSEAKLTRQSRLPVLDDDSDIGVEKEQIVIRDGKSDLAFVGKLIASAAPASAPKGTWDEYRIYETSAGKHVFSKVHRSIFVEDDDTHEAEVFDPSPSSVSSQLLRGALDLTRSRPMTWTDAAASFFGYGPLAKTLYRKFNGKFEEHIS